MNKFFIFFLKLLAAIIMLQTLYFKFNGAQESIDLFTKLIGEFEAYMRVGTGIMEFTATVLLFLPRTTWLGAAFTSGLMSGAILSHFVVLGIEHNNDGGALFYGAVITFVAGLILLYSERKQIPIIGKILQ